VGVDDKQKSIVANRLALKTQDINGVAAQYHSEATELARELRSFSFPPFAPVRRQLFLLVRQVNELRRVAGLECVPLGAAMFPARHTHSAS
jgi:hypothetical protein